MSVPIPDAGETVRVQILPGARRCYERGLEYDHSIADDVTVVIQVDPNGAVQSAAAPSRGGVRAIVLRCVLVLVQRARFAAPGARGSTIRIPMRFAKKTL